MLSSISQHMLLSGVTAAALLQGVYGAAIQASALSPHRPSTRPNNATCTGKFKDISAQTFIEKMNPGWNLGNTLDAIETEGSWNNPPVVPSTFDTVRASGYKGLRIPVTWAYHYTSQSPDWTIDTKWMDRVEQVVDWVVERGMYALLNVHHDSWIWADFTKEGANVTEIEERFYQTWRQVGERMKCKGAMVGFEPINEPVGTTEEHGKEQNRLNDIFLRAINDAGGWNGQRVVTLVGSGEDSVKTSLWFKVPEALAKGTYKNPWAVQFHYYSPYDFIFSAWGKTSWGTPAELSSLESDLALMRSNFTDVPLIIGEWAASPVATEPAARWRYFDFFLRTAKKYNMSTVLWDNGNDFLDRSTGKWRDPVAQGIMEKVGGKGGKQSLVGSTVDAGAKEQESSAVVWHKYNTSVTDTTLSIAFNDNKLVSATFTPANATKRPQRINPTVSYANSTITLPASLLTSLGLSSTTSPGTIGTLTLTFSSGTPLIIPLTVYRTPSPLAQSNYALSSLPANTDLRIPIPWSSLGQTRPAAIKATKSDGVYLVDDWTQWLGPLQQGRMTYNNHWDWDGSSVILKAAAVEEVRRQGASTVFRIEFYPRVEGNWVEVGITV